MILGTKIRMRGRRHARAGIRLVHVLNECKIGREFDFMLVNLTEVLSIDVPTLQEFAGKQNPRVRLNPPYREHLSQAFARLFMRVGLPVDIPKFS